MFIFGNSVGGREVGFGVWKPKFNGNLLEQFKKMKIFCPLVMGSMVSAFATKVVSVAHSGLVSDVFGFTGRSLNRLNPKLRYT